MLMHRLENKRKYPPYDGPDGEASEQQPRHHVAGVFLLSGANLMQMTRSIVNAQTHRPTLASVYVNPHTHTQTGTC